MKKLLGTTLAIAAVMGVLGVVTPHGAAAAEQRLVTMGTGGVTGVYYPTGGAICLLVNKARVEHGIRCSVESTGGAVYNINAINSAELDMGIVQSDVQYNSLHGLDEFKAVGPFKNLRAVFSVHPEPFTVLARADSGIKNFADLKGKRVNIGNPGSGQRSNIEALMAALGWTKDDFALALELKSTEQPKALCDNKIDAMVFTAGHPNAALKEATAVCDTVMVNVDGKAVQKLIDDNEFYSAAVIPGGMYRGSDHATKTFGVRATVVLSASVPNDVVYEIVKAVFENFDVFKGLHPALAHLKKEHMTKVGLSAPLHEGALQYYREVGLIK